MGTIKRNTLFWGYMTISLSLFYIISLISLLLLMREKLLLHSTVHWILIFIFLGPPIISRIIIGIQIIQKVSYLNHLINTMLWSEIISVVFFMLTMGNRSSLILNISPKAFILIQIATLTVYYIYIKKFYRKEAPKPFP